MAILDFFSHIGQEVCASLVSIGRFICFLWRALTQHDRKFFMQLRYSLVQQGTQSLVVMTLAAIFLGMVLAMHAHATLSRFGATNAIGQLVALSVIKELGPVMSSLFFIGRSCSSITAELALMRITMQIDSLEVVGVNPVARVVMPRLIAVLLVAPLLVSIFISVAILAGSMMSIMVLNVDYGAFWANIAASVSFYDDVLNSLFKGTVFFFVAVAIAIYQGYFVEPHIEAVARATTRTVVLGYGLTLALDFILTSFTVF